MKRVKTFVFFVEPSSYTLDLIEHVHRPLDIDFTFFTSNVLIAKGNRGNSVNTLSNMPLKKRVAMILSLRNSYDLIIFNGYSNVEFVALFLSNLFKRRFFIAIESDTQPKDDSGLKGFLKKLALSTIFKNSSVLGFAGGSVKHRDYFKKYGMDEERIFLMPMMVNNETFYFDREKPKKPFVFLYVGRIIPHKNVEFLIKSFRKAFGEQEDVLLRIVGRGESLDVLKSKYEKEKNILFEGAKFAEDLVRVYHSSHVFVLPSLYEPWGLVVNEAMSASMPVLASDRVGAVGDLVKEGKTGFVFNPENEDQLSDLMKRVYEDRALFTRLSKNARELMQKKWNYDLYMKNLKKALAYVEERMESRG